MKLGSVLMRYDLDSNGNEIGGTPLCASTSYKKVYNRLRHVCDFENGELGEGEELFDYDTQVVVRYNGNYGDGIDGVRYIIESLEIL